MIWNELELPDKPYYQDDAVIIYHADCRDILPLLPAKSIDLVLTDPPYGITSCKWDTIIPFDVMWHLLLSPVKPNAGIIFTASQPFSSALVMSNPSLFRHEWIYQKRCTSNFTQAKYAPMKEHETVLVFGKARVNYYPMKEQRKGSGDERVRHKFSKTKSGEFTSVKMALPNPSELRYPSSVQEFNNRTKGDRGLHPTQKPLLLMAYLIKTYSLEKEKAIDPFLGSGTTAVASKLFNRKCIGIEIEEKYCEIAAKRCSQTVMKFEC